MRRRGLILLAILPGLLAAGCARPDGAAGPGPGGTTNDAPAAFERRAAAVAQQWRESGLTGAWRQGFVPLEPLTVEPERGYPDGDLKAAAQSGWYRLSGKLPDRAGQGSVAFPDGSSLPVPLVSAADAYRALAVGGQPQCPTGSATAPDASPGPDGSVSSPAGPCAVLTVTGAKLGTVTLRTSRGAATVPAWTFTIREMRDPMIRVAVAPQATTPVPELPAPPVEPDTWLVATQTLDRVTDRSVAYQLGVGACDKDIRPLVWESADVIVVGGSVQPPEDDVACVAMLKLAPVKVTLTSPVGDRVILDAVTAQPLVGRSP